MLVIRDWELIYTRRNTGSSPKSQKGLAGIWSYCFRKLDGHGRRNSAGAHFFGKEEVTGSILVEGSSFLI